VRAAYEEYRDDEFEVVSVNVQETETAGGEVIGRYGLDHPFSSIGMGA